MKKLDQYIQDNKHLFDEEPAPGHFERFQQKSNQANKKIALLRWCASIAASILLVLSAGIFWQHRNQPVVQTSSDCNQSNDMRLCYLNKMNDVAGQIDVLTKDYDEWDRQQIMDDVKNIIHATQTGIQTDIPKELPKETTQTILSEYYQHNLDCLHYIADTLEE